MKTKIKLFNFVYSFSCLSLIISPLLLCSFSTVSSSKISLMKYAENDNGGFIDKPLNDCKTLHNLNLQQIPKATGLYSNEKCTLSCWTDEQEHLIVSDYLFEGEPCPFDSTGVMGRN